MTTMIDRPANVDDRFEAVLAQVLRTGVALAAAIVAFGGVVFLWRHAGDHPAYRAFLGEPREFRSVDGIAARARAFSGRGLIQLGVLVLIATPIARVAFAIVGFLRQRDWLYVGVTVFVLLLLLYGLAP